MHQTTPTVIIASATGQMPAVLARLTTFLLQARYAFLQTFPSPGHADLDVFDQQQLLIHCSIHETEAGTPVPASSVLPVRGSLTPDLEPLVRALVHACTAPSEPQP